jgi:LEA14-like dessication related protein
MVVAVSPITYEVYLNDQKVGEGKADFSTSHSS